LESDLDKYELYPNPATNELRIMTGKGKNLKIEFFNVSGQKKREVHLADPSGESIYFMIFQKVSILLKYPVSEVHRLKN